MTRKGSLIATEESGGTRKCAATGRAAANFWIWSPVRRTQARPAAGYRDAGGQTGPHRVRQSAGKPVRARAFAPGAPTHGFTVAPSPESGDKLTRFGPFSSQCRAGNVKIRRGAWNEELFHVLEGFPDLAHNDEVDACSGALEMLNPEGGSWAIFEIYREQAEQLDVKKQPCQPAEPNWAPGSVEWQAAQDKKNRSS